MIPRSLLIQFIQVLSLNFGVGLLDFYGFSNPIHVLDNLSQEKQEVAAAQT